MSRGLLPMMVTVVTAVGVYYLWSVVLQKNDSAGMALGIIAAVLVSAAFTKLKKRK